MLSGEGLGSGEIAAALRVTSTLRQRLEEDLRREDETDEG